MGRSFVAVAAALMGMAAASQAVAQSTVEGGLVAAEERVAALEAALAGLLNPVSAITVDCSTDTIADALAQAAPGVPLTVTIMGTCNEDVVIERDDITLVGAAGDKSDEIEGGVTIRAAQRVTVQDLKIFDGKTSPFASFPAGVFLTNAASATLLNLIVSGHLSATPTDSGVGIWVRWNSFVLMDGVDVMAPAGSEEAVLITDGADARIENSTLVSAESSPFNGAALGLFRSAHVRVRNSRIENTAVDLDLSKALAITVTDTSNLRVQGGINNVTGNVLIESNSQADFRGVSFTGQTLIISQSGATYSGNPSIDGSIFLQEQSTLQAFGAVNSVDVSGTVECADASSGIVAAALVATGGVIDCTFLAGF